MSEATALIRHALPRTALVLGVGDGVDEAIARSLAEDGISTLTVVREQEYSRNFRQPDSLVPHWHSTEEAQPAPRSLDEEPPSAGTHS